MRVDLSDPEVRLKLQSAKIKWTSRDYFRNGYLEVDAATAKELKITKEAIAREHKAADKALASREKDAVAAAKVVEHNAAEAKRLADKEAAEKVKAADAAEEAARKAGKLPGR